VLGYVALGSRPLEGPSAPYDHPALGEVSVATDEVVDGDAALLADGLAEVGVSCFQARANTAAVQIDCAGPLGTVDLVTGPGGDVRYALVDPEGETAEALHRLLDASFLRLWPDDRPTVEGLVEDAEPDRNVTGDVVMPRDEDDQYPTRAEVTDSATWSLLAHYGGGLLQLHVRTPALEDRAWPFGAEHHATTVAEAFAALTAQGFRCVADGVDNCHRAADDLLVDLSVHGDQVVSALLTPGSAARRGGRPVGDVSGQWVRDGLLFLTPAVRAAVGARIQECWVAGQGFRGVVAGTPLDVDVHPGRFEVQVGVPLLHVE